MVKYLLVAVSIASVGLTLFLNQFTAVGVMLMWGYILLGMAVLTTVAMPIVNIVRNPRGSWRSFMGLVVIAALALVCYLLSSAEPVPNSAGGLFVDKIKLRLSDTGLYLAYATMATAVLVVMFTEIRNSLR